MQWSGEGASEATATSSSSSRSLLPVASRSLGFALLLALSARMSLPIPGTPVPATLQALAVLLAGGFQGPWGAVASVCAYLAAGAAGAPVFARGGGVVYLLGPTGGYLLGLVPAAWIAGWISRRSSRVVVLFPGFLVAILAIHLSGWAQLSLLVGADSAVSLGVVPFLAFDAVKALVAAGVVRMYLAKSSLAGSAAERHRW
jgi:biotin transport system substrate-specific component